MGEEQLPSVQSPVTTGIIRIRTRNWRFVAHWFSRRAIGSASVLFAIVWVNYHVKAYTVKSLLKDYHSDHSLVVFKDRGLLGHDRILHLLDKDKTQNKFKRNKRNLHIFCVFIMVTPFELWTVIKSESSIYNTFIVYCILLDIVNKRWYCLHRMISNVNIVHIYPYYGVFRNLALVNSNAIINSRTHYL